MKKIFFLPFFCVALSDSFSQSVGIGTTTPNSSAQLEISSTNKGTLITRMTSAQRKAIVNPADGLLVYDLDKKTIYMYDGDKWQPMLFAINDNKLPAQPFQPAGLEAGDGFGRAVSISGDYAIVGAPADSESSPSQGSAYIFFRNNGIWTQQAKLLAGDPQLNGQFGFSVSIDGSTAVVGAPLQDGSGADEGRAYVFTRSGTVWTQVGYLLANDRLASDQFGSSVGISGQYAIVGAHRDDGPAGIDQGSVYVYNAPFIFGQGQLAKLTASDAAASDFYGYSVDISGDYIIIGSVLDDVTVGDQGSTYIYFRGAGWLNNQPHQAKLVATSPGTSFQFGIDVAITPTYAAVGSNRSDVGGQTQVGRIYAYRRSGTNWGLLNTLDPPDPNAGQNFGFSVELDGDYLVAGAILDDVNGIPSTGSAYLFKFNSVLSDFVFVRKIDDENSINQGQFGYSVAISGPNIIFGTNKSHPFFDRGGEVAFLNFE